MDFRKQLGNRGERLAEEFLGAKGMRVLERQWRSKFGELDLICLDGNEEVVFVEVKTRRHLGGGYPEESITPEKLRHLSAAGECFLREKGWQRRPYRFDLVAIVEKDDQQPEILHLQGI